MMIIGKTIDTLVNKFEIDEDKSSGVFILVEKIKMVVNEWLKDHSVHYVINSHPMNL